MIIVDTTSLVGRMYPVREGLWKSTGVCFCFCLLKLVMMCSSMLKLVAVLDCDYSHDDGQLFRV